MTEDLSALRAHQRRLLYGGGAFVTLLVILATIGSCLLAVSDYHAGQRQVFRDGQSAINAFLLQRNHGYTASLFANNAMWLVRQDDLIRTGEPLARTFAAQGNSLVVNASAAAVPWLVLGRGSESISPDRLAAYLGMIFEYSSYTSSSIAAVEASRPVVAYAYDPSGKVLAVTGVRDEAQLFAALGVSSRAQVFDRLVRNTPSLALPMGEVSFYFARNPVTGEPSLGSTTVLATGGTVYFRRIAFESVDRLRENLQPMLPDVFAVVSHGGELVVDSRPAGHEVDTEAELRSAGLWSAWPSTQTLRRHGSTYLIADRLKGVDWALVHTYTLRQMLGDLKWHLSLAGGAALLILAGLWLLLRRVDRRILAPALEDVIRARHDSERARREAESASRAKSVFVATMSHEIRTPLNGILGHLELLGRSRLDAAQQARLARIRGSADSLLGTISDVLDFSRIEAGQMDVEASRFDPRVLVDQVVMLFAPLTSQCDIGLVSSVDSDVAGNYVADEHRIRQILNNLVGNAVKFTESGQIGVRVSLVGTPTDEASRLRFEVTDSGIGMSEQQMVHLFEPFAQADASISRRFGGSGLGLALCQDMAHLLGGTIQAHSTLGVGSLFALEVPVAPGASLDGDAVPIVGEGAVAVSVSPSLDIAARVLLVDDNPVNRELILEQLETLGFLVDLAEDGEAALHRWRQGTYAAVLTDINMPRMNGYDLSRSLRDRGEDGPIIAVTAMPPSHDRQPYKDAGITDVLLKPISLAALGAALTRHAALPRPESAPRTASLPKPSAKVAQAFVEFGTRDVQTILDAMGKGEIDTVLERLHSLKGVLSMLGEREAARACLAMERHLEEGRTPEDDAAVRALAVQLLGVIERYKDQGE